MRNHESPDCMEAKGPPECTHRPDNRSRRRRLWLGGSIWLYFWGLSGSVRGVSGRDKHVVGPCTLASENNDNSLLTGTYTGKYARKPADVRSTRPLPPNPTRIRVHSSDRITVPITSDVLAYANQSVGRGTIFVNYPDRYGKFLRKYRSFFRNLRASAIKSAIR